MKAARSARSRWQLSACRIGARPTPGPAGRPAGPAYGLALGIAASIVGAGIQPAASSPYPSQPGAPYAGLLHPVDDAASGDFQQAQHLLLSESLGVAPRIIELLRSAADRRDPLAEYNLGYCYEQGIGLPRDPVLALQLYRRAAEHARSDDLRTVAGIAVSSLEDQGTPTEAMPPPDLEPTAGPAPQIMAATQDPPLSPAPAEAASFDNANATAGAASASMAQTAALPVISVAPALVPALPAPVQSVALTVSPALAPMADPAPAPPAAIPPADSAPATPPHPASMLPEPRIGALIGRGTEMLRVGNISAARLFFERAALAGSGPAAVLAGRTYDRRFLAAVGARGIVPDHAAAAAWYRQAAILGVPEANRLLGGLGASAAGD